MYGRQWIMAAICLDVRVVAPHRETGQTDQVASMFVRSTMASTTRSSTGCT